MTDTTTAQDVPVEALPPAIQEQVDKIAETTKKGFDLATRMKKRGLRKATITLFLEDEKGVELGWDRDFTDQFGNIIAPDREGIIGRLATLAIDQAAILATRDESGKKSKAPTGLEEEIATLTKQRDDLVVELTATAIVIRMRAVPPVIQKDTRRQAKVLLKLTEKAIPEDKMEEFNIAQTAYLMTVMFQSITDNETGDTNTSVSLDDAMVLMDWLPPGQLERLDQMMGQVQFTDSISRTIENQEDFS